MFLKRYSNTACALFVAGCCLWATPGAAHDVSASSVIVHVDDTKVEILQIMPVQTAADVAASLSKLDISADDEAGVLKAISEHWRVSGAASECELKRQAYRLQHHGVEIQLRYLYVCDGAETPKLLEATWLKQTPEEHFLVFTIKTNDKSKTVIFEHQDLAIDISNL